MSLKGEDALLNSIKNKLKLLYGFFTHKPKGMKEMCLYIVAAVGTIFGASFLAVVLTLNLGLIYLWGSYAIGALLKISYCNIARGTIEFYTSSFNSNTPHLISSYVTLFWSTFSILVYVSIIALVAIKLTYAKEVKWQDCLIISPLLKPFGNMIICEYVNVNRISEINTGFINTLNSYHFILSMVNTSIIGIMFVFLINMLKELHETNKNLKRCSVDET